MRERFQLLFIFSLENKRLLYKSNIVYKKRTKLCMLGSTSFNARKDK